MQALYADAENYMGTQLLAFGLVSYTFAITPGGMSKMLRARINTRAVWELLIRRNMTQNELARKAMISSGHLSQIINRERLPSAEVRRRLLEALAPIEFDDIFEIEEVPRRDHNE